jgi:hypothetical protein
MVRRRRHPFEDYVRRCADRASLGDPVERRDSRDRGRTLADATFMFFADSHTKNAPGRTVQHRCVAPTQHNRHRPRCTRTVAAGTLTFTARRGPNKARFDGRISTTKKLRPGRYRLVITATDTADGQQSASESLSFTIVR